MVKLQKVVYDLTKETLSIDRATGTIFQMPC